MTCQSLPSYKGFPDGSVAKNLPAEQGTWVQSLGWEDPLESEMATHPSTLTPGEFHGQRVLADYSPWGCTELDMTGHMMHVHRGFKPGQVRPSQNLTTTGQDLGDQNSDATASLISVLRSPNLVLKSRLLFLETIMRRKKKRHFKLAKVIAIKQLPFHCQLVSLP